MHQMIFFLISKISAMGYLTHLLFNFICLYFIKILLKSAPWYPPQLLLNTRWHCHTWRHFVIAWMNVVQHVRIGCGLIIEWMDINGWIRIHSDLWRFLKWFWRGKWLLFNIQVTWNYIIVASTAVNKFLTKGENSFFIWIQWYQTKIWCVIFESFSFIVIENVCVYAVTCTVLLVMKRPSIAASFYCFNEIHIYIHKIQ